ncbi:MAG: DnaJ C-terminal domain-containing protein [Actinomycetota bacterium]
MSQRDWFEKDYYAVLGVPKDASKADIRKAYRKLAQKHHPDAGEGNASAERFKEISEAHSVLSNDEKRKEYDEMRRLVDAGGQRFYGFGPSHPGGGGNVRINIGDLFGDEGSGTVFEDLLGGFGFGGRPRRGQDVETAARLSFEQAVNGTTLTIGGHKVRIPPGVGDGARIRVPGRGGGVADGSPGDLYVRVSVEPHPIFTRGPNGDLSLTLPVTFTEAALGAHLEVPTLEEPVVVKIPPGTRTGKTLRVKGRGGPRPKGGRGDLYVKVEVEVPQKLSRRERELLEQFAEVHRGDPRAHLDEHLNATSPDRQAS